MALVAERALARLSASQLAGLVRRGDVSPVEVLEAHLARIEELEPSIGAFVSIRRDEAIAEARRLERDPRLGDLPLAGVPVAIKDNVDVAGEPTRLGSAATHIEPAGEDEPMVARLREAGAIPVGKTKMPELAAWSFTEPEAFGVTRNPWDPSRTPGGSSGGSAAAVAAGMTPIAVASDGGGSIRIPSACCGVLGVKPGPGVVRTSAKLAEHWLGRTRWGPIAYSVDDAALALAAMAGDPSFATVPALERRLRVAVSLKPPDFAARVHPEVKDAVLETARLLELLGHDVEMADPPYPPDINIRWAMRWWAGLAKDARGLDRKLLEKQTRGLVGVGGRLWQLGLARPAEADAFHRNGRRWLGRYDLLVTAVTSSPAVAAGKWSTQGWFRAGLGQSAWVWTLPWSLARVPAASIPARLSIDGLPIGVQLVVNPAQEKTLLGVAEEIETVRGWPKPPIAR